MRLKFKTNKPYGFQEEIIDDIYNKDSNFAALFLGLGSGKTKLVIEIWREKCTKEKRALRTLVVTPLAVMSGFYREYLAHSFIDPGKIQFIDGTTKLDGKQLKNPQKKLRIEQASNKDAQIFITNTETLTNKDVWDIMLQQDIEFFILDESHKVKNPSAKTTKAAHKLSRQPQCKYKFILTGSPILQSALDLWSQMYILHPEILGTNYFSFRSKYFYDKNANMPAQVHFPHFIPKDKTYFRRYGYKKSETLEGLNEVIYKYAYRVTTDEVIDLPQRTYMTMHAPLHKDQKKIYDSMRDNLIAFLDGTSIEVPSNGKIPDMDTLPEMMQADLAITKLLRLQQLICGVFTSTEGVVKELPTNRIKIAKDLIEEILAADETNKIIIWTIFTPTYKQLTDVCKSLGHTPVMLTGRESRAEKQLSMDTFNTDKNCRIIIGNQASGGTGTQLQAGNYEIYYSRSFKLEDDIQSNARAYRAGQKRKTTRIDLVTEGTVDEQIVKALAKKREHAEDILAVRKNELTRNEMLSMV